MHRRSRIKLWNFSSRQRKRRRCGKSYHAYLLKRLRFTALIVFILGLLVVDYGTNRFYGKDRGYTPFNDITINSRYSGGTIWPSDNPPGGPTGLFTIYDGDTLRKGEFTFSIAYSNYDLLLNTTTCAQQIKDAHHVLFSRAAHVQVIRQPLQVDNIKCIAILTDDLWNKAYFGSNVLNQLSSSTFSVSYWNDMGGNDHITEKAPFIVVHEEQGNAVDHDKNVSRSDDLKQKGLSTWLQTETHYSLLGGGITFPLDWVRTVGNQPNIGAISGGLLIGNCSRREIGASRSTGSNYGNGINPGATETHSSYVATRLDRFGNCVSSRDTTRDREAAFVGRCLPLSGQSPERSEYGMSQKPTRRKEKIRLTLDISPETNVIIEELAEAIGSTKSEVLRRAIALMKFVADARSEGKRFGIAEKGQPLVTEIIGL
jgi:hypothetical protein